MIEVHLLRYVLAAADTGSFSRAADQFGVKQSTLSKRVQFLELRLGVLLFRRSTRGVVPTDPGQRFLTRARRIIHDVDALGRESRALAKGDTGVLKLGFHGSLAGGDLSAALKAYRDICPGVAIEARECDRRQLLDALENRQLDLAVLAGQQACPAIRSLRFWSVPLSIGLEPSHPLAERELLYWTDFRKATFLVTVADPGLDLSAMIVARLSGPGHRPRILVQDVSPENLLAFVTDDHVAVTACTARQPVSHDLVMREVHDAFGPTTLDQGVHWRSDNDNPALRRFLEMLARRYGRTLP